MLGIADPWRRDFVAMLAFGISVIPLAQARVSLGVALGHLLPDERLATAARWTGRALRIAWDLGG